MDNSITTILSNKNKVFCPCCTEEQDDFAEDYILPGVGHDSKCESVCWNCNNIFTAERLNKKEIRFIFE